MTQIVSDLHLGHSNIIEYCDRPFDSVSEMDSTLIENWNAQVDPEEKVIFLGDLVPFEERAHVVQGWLNKLNGRFVFIYGNHDEVVPIESHQHLTLNVHQHDLYLTHYPEHVPDDWDGWAVYGHHHNNFPEKYPFVDPDEKRINVSVELLGYEPMPITELFEYIDRKERLFIRPGVSRTRALQAEHLDES